MGVAQGRTFRLVTPTRSSLHQAMTVQDSMYRALGRGFNHGIFTQELLPDSGRTSRGIFLFDTQDSAFNLEGQLIGVAVRSTTTLFQTF